MKRMFADAGHWRVLVWIKCGPVLAAAICVVAAATSAAAQADAAGIAKKCSALTAKAFPPREPGNPAAGSAKGSGREEQEYFKNCVANGGNVGDAHSKDGH